MSYFVKPVRWVAVTATATASVLLATTGVANAASGTVNTAGSPLTVRASPGTGYDAWSTVADGHSVTILCQTGGSTVTGTYGTSSLWDMIGNGGFVSDTYVFTGSDGAVTHGCTYSADPPRANPSGRNAAISYEFARLGSTAEEGLCLHFQAAAYGWSFSGWATAEIGGDWLTSHGYMHTTGIPPRGALVWYHNSSGTGHVVLSLGEGKIIGSSVGGQVGVANYLYRTGYRGWTVAYLPAAG
ncbi:MAG TPA: hypothetical protein VIR27_14125 [Mycobacteriales bacterium]|jgi:Uncharacterized protein with a bacterial SH3 domain homologue